MDHLNPTKLPDLVITNKKKRISGLVDFANPVNHSENKRKRKKRQVFGPCQRNKKAVKHEGDGNTNPQRLG